MPKQAFEIVFQDEYIVIINKIGKLLVHASPKKEKNTLTSLLERALGQTMYPCHRLDRQTTGLLIYACSKRVQKKIMDQFRAGDVYKRYMAFVKGRVGKQKGIISGKILDKYGEKFGERAKPAKTKFRVLKRYKDVTVLDLIPLTGRTNQLRIQLAQIGHPILGEQIYAFRRDFTTTFKRLALHAYALSFVHPVSTDRIDFEISLPADMKEFLKSLEK